MSKLHFLKKKSKEVHKIIQLISNFWQNKYALFYESTCSLDEFDEKPNYMKISNS